MTTEELRLVKQIIPSRCDQTEDWKQYGQMNMNICPEMFFVLNVSNTDLAGLRSSGRVCLCGC